MSEFPTPLGHNDGFLDSTRPDGYRRFLWIGNQTVDCIWSWQRQTWSPYPAPTLQYSPASPVGSPQVASTMPLLYPAGGGNLLSPFAGQGTRQGTQPPPAKFPAPVALDYGTPSFTARMLLESSPPQVSLGTSGVAYSSTTSNEYYGLIGPLQEWPLPQGLFGYAQLSDHKIYYPSNIDPTAVVITEADAILTAMNNLFTAVNIVLAATSRGYQIRCQSEESHTVAVQTADGPLHHLSRVDKSWSYSNGTKWVPFAVLEFKRPGAIKQGDWFQTPNGTVSGSGGNICRQLKKYAYSFGLRFVGVCDLNTLMLLQLGGAPGEWKSATPRGANPTGAYYRCVNQQDQMKRQMYVFLMEALDAKLRADGLIH